MTPWSVLYLNRATETLYQVIREECPAGLLPLFLESGSAVAEALRAGRILGGGFDVYSPEPPGADLPLRGLDNVVLTPHVAAGTLDAFRTKMRFALANMRNGEEPLERVAGT
jgi:hypothetical protein